MDKSVIQKFSIIMSMFVAVFTTVIVCGNIVNGSGDYSHYRVPFTNAAGSVSYSDAMSVDGEYTSVVSNSDNVTVVPFIDDNEDYSDSLAEYEDESLIFVEPTSAFTSHASAEVNLTTVTTLIKPSTKTTAKPSKATTVKRTTTAASKPVTKTTTTATKATTTVSSHSTTAAASSSVHTTSASSSTTTVTSTTTTAVQTTASTTKSTTAVTHTTQSTTTAVPQTTQATQSATVTTASHTEPVTAE